MTSKLQIPIISKVNEMSGIKALVGKKMEKTVKFMGSDLKISKLLVSEVVELQNQAKALKEDDVDGKDGLEIIKLVIRNGAEGGKDLTEEDFNSFPVDELTRLSEEIMKHSGLGGKDQGK